MRELIIDSTEYAFKKRRQKKVVEYETKDYLGGLSFVVKEGDIDKWNTYSTIFCPLW